MKRLASEVIRDLEIRVAQLEKESGLFDFIFGTKEERILKQVSKEVIKLLDRVFDDIRLKVDRKGLIEGSFMHEDNLYNVSSEVIKNIRSKPALSMHFSSELEDISFKKEIEIGAYDPLRGHYIFSEPPTINEPNIKGVHGFVVDVVKSLLFHEKKARRNRRASRLIR